MALPLANILGTAALGAATPYLSKALRGIFGEDEATRERERALAEIDRVAKGGTTQGQAAISYARGRALSDLEAQASRGTAQQQAGLRREAMGRNVEAQAQYAAQLAELRAREQEKARETSALLRAQKAREEGIVARSSAAKFAEGLLTPLSQQLSLPDAKPAKPSVRMAGATVSGTAPTAARVRPAAPAAAPEDPFAEVSKATLTGEIIPGFGLALAGGPQTSESAAMQDLGALQQAQSAGAAKAASAVADYEPFAYGFTKQEMESPSLATGEGPAKPSIYAMGGLDTGGVSLSQPQAPAPIAMSGFGSYLNPGRAPVPQMAPNSPVTPTRRKAVVAPKQRLKPINLGDVDSPDFTRGTYLGEVDSPEFALGRRPAKLRTR